MFRRFASILHADTHGYSFDSGAWSSTAPIDAHFQMYQTYGDRNIQHSGSWPITEEYFTDYLLSITAAMIEDEELANHLRWTLAREPRKDDIEFCAGIVFKPEEGATSYEKANRYYSVSERKVTKNREKEHDKRYQRVTDIHDGSAEAIYRMTIPEYAHGLERYLWANAVHAWAMAQKDGPYMQYPALFLKWTDDMDKAREMQDALEAARGICESYRLRHNAIQQVDRTKKRLEREKETAANDAA
jgi:hypothetical protein